MLIHKLLVRHGSPLNVPAQITVIPVFQQASSTFAPLWTSLQNEQNRKELLKYMGTKGEVSSQNIPR